MINLGAKFEVSVFTHYRRYERERKM